MPEPRTEADVHAGPRPLGALFPPPELPADLSRQEYRQRARALVQQAADEPHGPRADRLVAQAHVFALCALSATDPNHTTHAPGEGAS